MIGALRTAWDFVVLRWDTTVEADPAVVVGVGAAVVLLTAIPSIWRVVRQASTIVHEMGHVIAALLSGRKVKGIALHTDTSGVTVSRGRPTGPGMLLTTLAGYPAPGLLALGLAVLSVSGYSGAALTLYQVIMLAALLLARNAVGIISCLLSVLITGVIWWHNDPQIVGYTVVALGIFYAVAGVRGTLDVCRVHLRSRRRARGEVSGTDASQAARAWRWLPLPPALWLFVFLLTSSGCAAAVFWLLLL